MPAVISVENLCKSYRLGQIGSGTLTNDLRVWWAKKRGQSNPLLKIGQQDHGNRDGEEVWALRDVSFQVEQGEVLGVIGRNGAGKSTLLKILSRVTAPTSGCVKVKGRIASLLEVGTGFHPELTGRENIYLNGAILGMSKEEVRRKFDEIVAFAEVEKFIDTPVKRYSSGMYVRLAFAVAAHLEPEILIVDEVLAVGDADFQSKCLGKMGDVAKEGRTVLFVSHNMGAIKSLCTSGLLLEKGVLALNSSIDDLMQVYPNGQKIKTLEKNFERLRKDCTYRVMVRDIDVVTPHNFHDPLKLTLDLDILQSTEKFSIEWFIRDSYGNRVASCLSSLTDNVWFSPGNEKTCRIESVINDWQFPGGDYYISVLVTSPGIECFDAVNNLIMVHIPDMYPNKSFQFKAKYGYFLPRTTWRQIRG